MTTAGSAPGGLPMAARLAALVVAGALFMEMLDATIIVTALPALARSFAVRPSDLGLGVTGYAVALAAFIPASGWAADRFGGRRMFIAAIALFTVASLLCAAATTLPVFVGARILQGAAAAMMSPVGRLLILSSVERKDLVRAIAIITWPALVAPLLGPVISGWIVDHASWRWIFLLNLPLGVAGIMAALRWLPVSPPAAVPRPLDWMGLSLTALALAALVTGLDMAGRAQSDPTWWISLLAVAVVSAVLTLVHARRTPHPLLNFAVLKVRTFAVSAATSGALSRLAINATPFLLPLMFQEAFRFSASRAGLMLLVYMAGNLAMKPATTWILERFGFRDVLVVNTLIGAAALGGVALSGPSTPAPLLWVALFVAGLSRSMNFTSTNTLTFADIEPDQRSDATALSGVLQQVTFSLGIAMAAFALNVSLGARGASTLGPIDFRIAIGLVAGLLVVSAVGYALRLPADAGAALRAPRG